MPVSGDQYAKYTGVLSGNMKTAYQKGAITNYYPADTPFIRTIGGVSKPVSKVGNKFVWPLGLTFSQGHVYAAAGSGAFPFRRARPGKVRQAEVDSTNHMHRTAIDWESLERAKDGNGNIPDGAFEDSAKRILQDLRTGTMQRIEESFLYAGTNGGIFVTGSAVSETITVDGSSVAVVTLTLTYESFAAQLFTGKEGAPYDLWQLDSNGRPTGSGPLNDNGTEALGDGTTTNRPLVLERFLLSTRKVSFSGHATDISDIVTAVNAGSTYGLTYWGQKGNDTRGMDDAITNGTSANIYGLDPNLSVFLQGHVADNGNTQLTFTRFMRHLDPLVQLGLTTTTSAMSQIDGTEKIARVDVWLNPTTWRDLMVNETGLVRHNSPGGTVRQGFDEIEFSTDVGRTRFISYPKIKKGEAFVLPTSMVCKTVGATEPYLKDWSNGKEEYLRQLEGVAGVEAAMYGNLGLYIQRLAWCLKIKNIRNSDYA